MKRKGRKMETKEKKEKSRVLRIALSESTRAILNQWKSNLETEFSGIRVSYLELVGWAVERTGPTLSKKDIVFLRERFFDQVRQLEWLLSQAKAAKARGEEVVFPEPKTARKKKSEQASEAL